MKKPSSKSKVKSNSRHAASTWGPNCLSASSPDGHEASPGSSGDAMMSVRPSVYASLSKLMLVTIRMRIPSFLLPKSP